MCFELRPESDQNGCRLGASVVQPFVWGYAHILGRRAVQIVPYGVFRRPAIHKHRVDRTDVTVVLIIDSAARNADRIPSACSIQTEPAAGSPGIDICFARWTFGKAKRPAPIWQFGCPGLADIAL